MVAGINGCACSRVKRKQPIRVNRLHFTKAFLVVYRTMQYGPIRAVIEQSLCDLPDVEKILFQSLVIFGDNVRIPLSLLQLYWNKTAAEVEQIVEKFDRLYIVCIDKTSPRISCSLQYLYCSYLSYDVKPDIQIKMHRELIESYKYVRR